MRFAMEKNENGLKNKKLMFDKIDKFPVISEVFVSLEGEGNSIGEPSLYLRLSGCYSAKCSWCDSKYSWFSNKGSQLEKLGNDILEEIGDKDIRRVTITGGEPLHYMDSFVEIIDWLIDLGIKLEFIGIESNGNLLHRFENTISTLKAFNTIYLKHKVEPVLTISPKLKADACYDNELKTDEIKAMYLKVISNTLLFINAENLYFKFVWDLNDSNEENLYFIEELKNNSVKNNHIMLMPWTPEEAMFENKTEWFTSQQITAKQALELGIKYSPRLHIDLNMD